MVKMAKSFRHFHNSKNRKVANLVMTPPHLWHLVKLKSQRSACFKFLYVSIFNIHSKSQTMAVNAYIKQTTKSLLTQYRFIFESYIFCTNTLCVA